MPSARRPGEDRRRVLEGGGGGEVDDAGLGGAVGRLALEGTGGVEGGDGDEVAVAEAGLKCDAVAFEALAQSGSADEALAVYGGDFLQGFHVTDASSEYEEWVERTRTRLRRRAAAIARTASENAERANDGQRAVEYARRACQLELDEEAGWRHLMSLQTRLGDRAAALHSYEELRQRLERDLGVRPAGETVALAQAIRSSNRRCVRSTPKWKASMRLRRPSTMALDNPLSPPWN